MRAFPLGYTYVFKFFIPTRLVGNEQFEQLSLVRYPRILDLYGEISAIPREV